MSLQSSSEKPMLSISDVHLRIGDSSILNGVTFDVAKGEVLGIIGPNGSGKTTLFNCISGFQSLSKGEIYFEGERITQHAPNIRAELGIGRVFQSNGIFRELSLRENIMVALESRDSILAALWPFGSSSTPRKKLCAELLQEVGLSAKANEKAGSLSGGQLRLLEIVRALAFGAKLLLLDEPTAGVSPKMREEVAKQIEKLKALGKTVLIIEHDLAFIQRFCERIVVIDQGRAVLDDSPSTVRQNPLLQEIYFGAR